jgi:hypothetical protein
MIMNISSAGPGKAKKGTRQTLSLQEERCTMHDLYGLQVFRHPLLKGFPSAVFAGIAVLILMGIISCASQTVRHLKQHPWSLHKPQSMRTNYLSINFICTQDPEGLRVKGHAYPLPDGSIPEWATWARDLWLGAYLSDRSGQVLAQEIKVLPPQELSQSQPIVFSFVLEPHSMGEPGPVFISFGYRLVLAPGPQAVQGKSDKDDDTSPVFFASESALTRF